MNITQRELKGGLKLQETTNISLVQSHSSALNEPELNQRMHDNLVIASAHPKLMMVSSG